MIEEERITTAFFLPYLISDITERIKSGRVKPFKLRYFYTGGDVIPQSVTKVYLSKQMYKLSTYYIDLLNKNIIFSIASLQSWSTRQFTSFSYA